jgi:predicted ATPase/transcriptional regulator with XRE-family HTH domain
MEAAGRPRFGALLRQFRLDAGMTQQELAERANLSADAVSTLERGARTRPYRETIVLLGRALDLSPEREALLESSIDVAHSPRRRERVVALKPSLLNIVRSDTLVTPRHNLPQQLTSFVGRRHEVGEIKALSAEHRLVTVVGAGGVGKTRIALETGNELLDGYPDGVWLADLAPLADQTLVANTVLSALQLPSTAGSALDTVVAYLRARRLLLILDNCEHVIARTRDVAACVVQSCPQVRVLATSRQALDIPGERVYRLPSMAVPPDSRGRAQDALRYGAVALFVDRAHAVNSSFALVDDNAPEVSEICRHLDGIPLAIELAAARVKVLAPRQIAQRLNQRFRLLTGGDSRALPRHQTMTALIDWSYDLLTAREQRFFESLSVFAGGCTLEAAIAVCATDGEDDVAVIDLITSLVTKSLLVAELVGDEQRYRFLESSRQYARNKLIALGVEGDLAGRHALYYLELAERLERARDAISDREWLPQAKAELENWRAALEWTLAKRGDVILGQRLAAARGVIWSTFTPAEAQHWVRAALASVDKVTPRSLVVRLEHASAGAGQFGSKQALAAAQRAMEGYRTLGDALGFAQAQHLAGAFLVKLGSPEEGEALLREALKAARTLGNRRLTVRALIAIGFARSDVRDFASSRVQLTEAIELAKMFDGESFVAAATANLARTEFFAGDAETALRLTLDLLTAHRDMRRSPNFSEIIGAAHCNAVEYLAALGRYDEARTHATEALRFARRAGLPVFVAISLWHLAEAVLRSPAKNQSTPGGYKGAARLLGFVGSQRNSMGLDVGDSEYDSAIARLRKIIDPDELKNLLAAGATMTEDEALAQADALE